MILSTDRLNLRELQSIDAPFILELLNQPAWLKYIGDRGVYSVDDAAKYIENGPGKMYREQGVGLYLVELASDKTAIGICGLIKRDSLPDIDIGFAFMSQYWGSGYAYEAAKATLEYAQEKLNLKRVIAITHPDNINSIKLLEKIGLKFEKMIKADHKEDLVKLWGINFEE